MSVRAYSDSNHLTVPQIATDKNLYREQNEREVEMWPWIEPANFVVQLVIAAGLIWYTCETWKIRKASQEQIATSQEQNEIMQKPCLVPSVRVRDDCDTAAENLSGNLYPGYRVVENEPCTGHVALRNIGSGAAFKHPATRQVQSPKGIKKDHLSGYLPYIRRQGKESILLVASNLISEYPDKDVVLKLSYENLGGHRYDLAAEAKCTF